MARCTEHIGAIVFNVLIKNKTIDVSFGIWVILVCVHFYFLCVTMHGSSCVRVSLSRCENDWCDH